MRIRHYSLTHRCWQKWYFDFFNEFPYLFFGSCISHSLTNNNQRFVSESDDINGFLDLRKGWTKSWRLGENWYFDFSFDHFIEDISGKIQKNRAWSADGCESDCLINVIRDVFGWSDSNAVFCVGFHKIALVNLLEGSFFSLIEIVGSTD